jgi:transposase InsO family protein
VAVPAPQWQTVTEAFPWTEAPSYLIRDRDRVYGAAVMHRLRAMGIRDKPIAPGSPWQNGFAERLIGSIRRGSPNDRRAIRGRAPYRVLEG